MIRDITLGQYYPAKSVIHQLDPRVKLVATMLYIISLFVAKGILGYVIATIFLAFVIRTSKVPFKFITKGLKAIVMLLMITVVFNLFLIDGDVVLWHFGFLKITDKGLRTAILMGVRLIYLIIGSSLMTLTTTPNDLTDGMERLLNPLKAVHVPVHEISMMMSIALRFIPTLTEETDKIMSAQKARGADFTTGSIMQRARSLIPVFIPLIVSAFRRADELAVAMECRCYHGGKGRTRMTQLRLHGIDFVMLAVIIFMGSVIVGLNYLPL